LPRWSAWSPKPARGRQPAPWFRLLPSTLRHSSLSRR
jgi:hypothetical protein